MGKEKNDLNYMQNIDQTAISNAVNHLNSNTIQPGDQLVILVSAVDNKVAAPFNKNYSSSNLIQPFAPGGNVPTEGQTSISGPTYVVDPNGDIVFPELGSIHTNGKTLDDLRLDLTERLSRYIIKPTVSIRIANFRVTVLGEVNRQGEYVLSSGQGTLLNALSMAGDLSMYGTRTNILVVRTVDGVRTNETVDLTDAKFFNSPYYYLKQGDVIYVSSNKTKERISKQDPNIPIYLTIVGSLITIFALIFRK